MNFKIADKQIGKHHPVFFIADIASNHGGDLEKAKELIFACSDSGVDAIKMQNFSADTIVSDYGFKNLTNVNTHQSTWKTSVDESYKAASIPFEWTLELKELSESLGLAYFTSPYSIELVRMVEPYVSAFKLGSGDITWHEEISEMASYDKPLIIATGASNLDEVKLAVEVALSKTSNLLLMQCNTNYTASKDEERKTTEERLRHVNLKVLETYSGIWPNMPLGLSDHTHGALTVLGAVGLFDCAAVEKHFTLDSSQEGQDHSFSMMPGEWKEMVTKTKELKERLVNASDYNEKYQITKDFVDEPELLDLCIGDGEKKIEKNEINTVIVQRRSIRVGRDMKRGENIKRDDLIVLRPCPKDGIPPYEMDNVVGSKLKKNIKKGDHLTKEHL